MKYVKIIISFMLVIILVVCIIFYKFEMPVSNTKLGMKALHALYEFHTLDEFEENMKVMFQKMYFNKCQ